MNFNELSLRPEILKAVDEMGFEAMTPIQEEALPIVLKGSDIIGQAQTGTGKTAAFAIPFLQNVTDDETVQVLVLTPTRELCMQVEKEVYRLSRYLPVRSIAIYGGQDITRQIKGLKNRPQIIVATPGRLIDHLNRHTIRLNNLRMVVLDEADEMLNMGFIEDIETILQACSEDHQTMMFSATMRPEIQAIANKYMKNPSLVSIKAEELTVPAIEQIGYVVEESKKFALLARLLDMLQPELAMVFGRTKRRVDELARALQQLGYRAEGLHGDLSQHQRDNVMYKFRNGQIDILVATDVAARGIDVDGVSHVFNFDLPQDADSYVHRVGRTGRAGSEGLAISFIDPSERFHMRYIERTIRHDVEQRKLPTEVDSRKRRRQHLIDSVVLAIQEGAITNYQEVAQELIDQYGAEESLSAVLKLLAGDGNRDREAAKIKLTAERPLYSKRGGSGKSSHKGGKSYKDYGSRSSGASKGGYKPKKGGKPGGYSKNKQRDQKQSFKKDKWN